MNGKTYGCNISPNDLYIKEILDYPTNYTVCMDASGDFCLSLYNATSVPYTFEPLVIQTVSSPGEILESEDNLKEGMIEFSVIHKGIFYMGYRCGNLLTLYSWNQQDGLKKLEEYENIKDIVWTVYDEKLYIYFDGKLKIIN